MDPTLLNAIILEPLKVYFPAYITALALLMLIFAAADFIVPARMIVFWQWWTGHQLFRVHGLLLMIGGLPLTQFRDSFTGYLMCAIGVFSVLTGPFILLYPDRFKGLFDASSEENVLRNPRQIIYTDGVIRILSALILLYTIFFSK